MTRTTVNIDDELLSEAQQTLGTAGISATVNAALAATVRQARLAAFDVRMFDVTDQDVADARRDRLAVPPASE